jgi:hypothetical protein
MIDVIVKDESKCSEILTNLSTELKSTNKI